MISGQYSYNKPIYLAPVIRPVKVEEYQPQSYQTGYTNYSTTPEIYQTNSNTFNEYETYNSYNQINNINEYAQDNSNNQFNSVYSIDRLNQTNNVDMTNEIGIMNSYNQYNIPNNNIIDYSNQINSYNQYNVTSAPNYTESTNTYIPIQESNQYTSYPTNISYQGNEIYTDNQVNQVNLESQIVPVEQNVSPNVEEEENEIKQVNIIKQVNEVKQDNEDNEENQSEPAENNEQDDYDSSEVMQVDPVTKLPVSNNSIEKISNNNIEKQKEEEIEEDEQNVQNIVDSPRLINPLASPVPPSPIVLSNQNEQQIIEENKELSDNIFQDVKKKDNNLFDKESEKFNDFNIKSHFELSLIKEPDGFIYKKVRQTGQPLLSHFEMPQNYEYNSPTLSPNGKYLACIARGSEDFVYVWEINDLYWYKYKFSSSRVDGITFTPDSDSIIIVYKDSHPIMYNLSNGKKILEFEKNGEEDNREGFQCSFTTTNTHFAYTTSKSFTLWSLRTGKVKQQIIDDSPIKIISDEYLICIDSDLNCEIKKISNQRILYTFKIKGVESPKEILDAQFTRDMTSFFYVIKEGIIKYIFLQKEYIGIQKFECGVERASISDDCKYILKTNMKNLSIYDLENQQDVLTILKEKFKQYKIYFKMKKLLAIDDISINIQDYEDEGSPQKYIWLNKNPVKFEDVKFSRDFKLLFARVNRNEAIAYNLKTGYIIRKWQNFEENWLDFAMTRFGGDKIATKSNLLLIKVWNFIKNKEEACFYGYNSHSLCFSGDGNYLACGANTGSEVARIWDINNNKYGIFRNAGNNNNFHTIVHLTSPKPKRLICCSTDQQPLIFNSYTQELLFTCECPYRFEEIYEIKSDYLYDVFIIKGRDDKKLNVGLLYKISDGTLVERYENYSVLELAKNLGILVCKCPNVNGGKLTSINIKDLNEPIYNDFQIQTEKCKLLEDDQCAIIEYGDEFNKEYNLINVENGNYIGKISFVKKGSRNSQAFLIADPFENEINFKYFEFLSPEETMILKKKNPINIVEGKVK